MEYVLQIDKIINNKKLKNKLATSARKLAIENYDWGIIGQNMNRIYETLKENYAKFDCKNI
jgi:hypothetical protein